MKKDDVEAYFFSNAFNLGYANHNGINIFSCDVQSEMISFGSDHSEFHMRKRIWKKGMKIGSKLGQGFRSSWMNFGYERGEKFGGRIDFYCGLILAPSAICFSSIV